MLRSYLSTNNHKIVVDQSRKYLRIYHRQPFHIDLPSCLERFFADPDTVVSNGTLLKDGNKTTVVKITHGDIELVIKRFNIVSRWHAITRGIRKSRAHRCWVYAHLLKELGVDTPEPVAILEQRYGPVRQSAYYIMRYRKGQPGRNLILDASKQERDRYFQSLASDLGHLHDKMITHGDLKATNWLWDKNHWIWLDLDATRQHPSRRSFTFNWYRDMRRLLQNWRNRPDILEQAKATIPWTANIKPNK